MFVKLGLFVLASVATCSAQTTLSACSAMSLGTNGALNGFVPASGDAWHQDISAAAVDPNSATIINTAGDLAGAYLHPDFSTPADGGAGIPYNVVDSSQTPSVPVAINLYVPDSDITVAPIPASATIEGSPASCPTDSNDRHMIVLDRNKCVAYEYYQAGSCNGSFSAANTALWDMSTTEHRPYGLTSVDAAGLSVFEGLVRYDEIVAGSINHAIRFTAQHTKNDANNGYFASPATHAAGNNWGTDNIIGMRLRLKASFDVSGYSATNQIILNAMKKYGMILADNGSNMFFQGTTDSRWDDDDLSNLKNIPASAFDVVQMGTVLDASTAPTGAAPAITGFTASSTTVAPGTTVTLTPVVQNASYNYIDNAGFVRGASVTVTPTATTTYTLSSRNAYGTSTASVTVNVSTAAATKTALSLKLSQISATVYAITATTNSPAAVTYAVASGAGSINGNVLTVSGAGTVVVSGTQPATASYTSASATGSVTVAAENPGLSVKLLQASATTYALAASSSSSAPVTYSVTSGPGAVSGTTLTATGSGTIVVAAQQAPAGLYASATATGSVTAAAAANPGLAIKLTAMNASATMYAITASSSSSGAVTYTVTSGQGTVSGNVLTATAAGPIVVSAQQAANGSYAAASASGSATVPSENPGLMIKVTPVNATTYAMTATTNSPGAVTYVVISGPGTVSGNVLTATGAGTITVWAEQAPSGLYENEVVKEVLTATVPAQTASLALR
jgi:hypothetical protein